MQVIITTGRKEDPLSLIPYHRENPDDSKPGQEIVNSASGLILRAQRESNLFFFDKFEKDAASRMRDLGSDMTEKQAALIVGCAIRNMPGAGLVFNLEQPRRKAGRYVGFRPLEPEEVIYFLSRQMEAMREMRAP